MKTVKLVLIPCLKDEKGNFLRDPRYSHQHEGYHHIMEVYAKGAPNLIATIVGDIELDKAEAVMKVIGQFLGDGIAVETDPDFFNNSPYYM